MGEDVTADVALLALDELNVGLHSLLGKVLCEEVVDVGVGVETGEGDELEDEAELSEVPDEALHLVGTETSSVPVERRAEVVGEPLAGALGVNTVGELLGLGVDGALGLHPDEVGVGSKGNSTVDGALCSTAVTEVALTCPGGGPVPEGKLLEAVTLGSGDGIVVRSKSNLLLELGGVDALALEGLGEDIAEELEVGRLGPLVLNLLKSSTSLALGLGLAHDLGEGGKLGVGGTKDEGVVTWVNVGGDEGSGLRVGTGNDEVGGAHDVALEAHSDETVDVLRDGDKNLSGHVATLLCSGSLVLNVDTSSTRLDHHLGKLHDSGKTTVSSVGIGDDGAEVVDVRSGVLALGDSGSAGEALLAVVVELGLEKLGNLVGDSVGGVVSKIRSGLERGRCGRRALPSGDVDGLEVLGHLGDLDGVKGAVSGSATTALTASLDLEDLPKLLGSDAGRVLHGDGTALGDDIGGSVGTGSASKTGLLRMISKTSHTSDEDEGHTSKSSP